MQLVKQKSSYERVVVTRDEALGMFQENKFKVNFQSSPLPFPDECPRRTRCRSVFWDAADACRAISSGGVKTSKARDDIRQAASACSSQLTGT